MLKRATISKRMRTKLSEVKTELMRRRHRPIPEQGRWLASVVRGHLAYYAVPGNIDAVATFRNPGNAALVSCASTSQSAQPPRLGANGSTGNSMAPTCPQEASLARGAIRRSHPRQEPSAVVPLAGICAGGGPNPGAKGLLYRDPIDQQMER